MRGCRDRGGRRISMQAALLLVAAAYLPSDNERCKRFEIEELPKRQQKLRQLRDDLRSVDRRLRNLAEDARSGEARKLEKLRQRVEAYNAELDREKDELNTEAERQERLLVRNARNELDHKKWQYKKKAISAEEFSDWQAEKAAAVKKRQGEISAQLKSELAEVEKRRRAAGAALVAGAEKIHREADADVADVQRRRNETAAAAAGTDKLEKALEAERQQVCAPSPTTTTTTTRLAQTTSTSTTTATTTLWKDELNQPADWHGLWKRMEDLLHRVFQQGLK